MAKRKQKRARAHHLLPQFYLRAWANENGAVAMLSRDGSEVVTGTAALGVQTDFYTVTRPDGEKNSVVEEGLLQAWDGRGAEVHKRLLDDDFPLDDDARINFGLFMALQWLRGRTARQRSQETHDLITKLLVTHGLDVSPGEPTSIPSSRPHLAALGRVQVPALGGLPERLKTILRDTDAYKFEPSQEELILRMVKGVPDVAAHFIETDWILMRLQGQHLLTSDEPISLYRAPTPQNANLGLGPANAEFVQFPLSPSRCLLMRRKDQTGHDGSFDAPAAALKDLNGLTARGLWRQFYRHPDSPPFPAVSPFPDRLVTAD